MFDLVGMPYRLGSDGSDGHIDCIHLCYRILHSLDIPTPKFKTSWYQLHAREILYDLNAWGVRVNKPIYNGDVCLLPSIRGRLAFGTVWNGGILAIGGLSETVCWRMIDLVPSKRIYRYCPMKSS